MSQKKIQVRKNKVDTDDQKHNQFKIYSIESTVTPIVTDEQASYLEQVYGVQSESQQSDWFKRAKKTVFNAEIQIISEAS